MSSDPTLPNDEAYRAHVMDQVQMVSMSHLLQKLCSLTLDLNRHYQFLYPDDQEYLWHYLTILDQDNIARTTSVHEKLDKLYVSEDLRKFRKDELKIPQDERNNVLVQVRELKSGVGIISYCEISHFNSSAHF